MKNAIKNLSVTVLMTVIVCTMIACGAKYDPETDFQAEPIDGGKGVEIASYDGAKWEVKIPPKIQKIPVTGIRNEAFLEKNLTSVTIPKSVTTIGESAFRKNQLTKITLPNNITNIGNNAFAENQLTSVKIPHSVTHLSGFNGNQITDIVIPDSVTSIGEEAFADNQLSDVTIPKNVSSIGKNAFANNKLTGITIPNSVIDLGGFSGNQLTSIEIPDSVTSIGDEAFGNNQLTSVTIPENVVYLSGFNDNQLTSIIIPESVTTIGSKAFSGNQLTGITIPNSVTTIGDTAFSRTQLTSIVIGENVQIYTDTSSPGNSSFGNNGFERAYNNNRRVGWTYTRSNNSTTSWIRQPKSVKITGIDSKYNGMYWIAGLYLTNDYGRQSRAGVRDHYDMFGDDQSAYSSFSNGTLTVNLYRDGYADAVAWFGSGSYYVCIQLEGSSDGYHRYVSKSKISFDNIVTEIPFTNFNFIESFMGQ